jgi:acyl-CoA hydrolase
MKLMDNAAGIAAVRHARTSVVTARVDELEFLQPVHIGNLVTCNAQVTFVGSHSMEVLVTVMVENLKTEEPANVALTAYFTMVAMDKNGVPTAVPPLEITNDEERRLFEEGQKRYLVNKQKRIERIKDQ